MGEEQGGGRGGARDEQVRGSRRGPGESKSRASELKVHYVIQSTSYACNYTSYACKTHPSRITRNWKTRVVITVITPPELRDNLTVTLTPLQLQRWQ